MGDVIEARLITRLPIPVEKVLRKAGEGNLSEVVVLGFTEDGDFYFGASQPDGPSVLWLLELAKKELLEVEI